MTALERAKVPVGSVTIGIVSGGDLVWSGSFGFADMEDKRLATKDSVYRIGTMVGATRFPDGALYTTVGDLAKFVVFELGEGPEAVLEKKTLEDNFSRVNSTFRRRAGNEKQDCRRYCTRSRWRCHSKEHRLSAAFQHCRLGSSSGVRGCRYLPVDEEVGLAHRARPNLIS